ncbi:MAG: glycosyltransferase family 4 protein [Pirellulales bacterium]
MTPRVPFPLTDGGALGIFNITRELAALGHEVHMVALSRTGIEETAELEKFCTLTVVKADTQTTKLGALSALLSGEPYTTRKYWHPDAASRVLEIAMAGQFDLVHVDHLHMVQYGQLIRKELGIPVALREHNFETTIVQRFYENQRNLLLKVYAYIEYIKLARFEGRVAGEVDLNVMITDEDEKRLLEINPTAQSTVMAAGVDTDYFRPGSAASGGEASDDLTILSVASMDWHPNVDAVIWFCDEVMPKVLKSHPSAVLQIVGRGVPDSVRSKASDNVKILGFVDDVRESIERASVMIVPLRIGGGMRLKILNAMAMAKAIVSTPVGCEGIAVEDGVNIAVAESAGGFADRISELLGDHDRRAKMGQAGLEFVRSTYVWSQLVANLEPEYVKLVENFRSTRSR